MAHQRKLIRKAVAAILVAANTAAGARVQTTRIEPSKNTELPAISVYALSDDVDEEISDQSAPRELTRELHLEIAGWVAHKDSYPADDAMDDLAEQIEAALDSDWTLPAYLAISAIDTGTGQITIAGHGLGTGAAPAYILSSGTIPTGLAAFKRYYVIVDDPNTIRLALSLEDAVAGTEIAIADAGSGALQLKLYTASNSILSGSVMEIVQADGRSDPLIGIVVLTYKVTFITAPAVNTAFADFTSVDAKYPIAGSSPSTPVTEDEFTVQES